METITVSFFRIILRLLIFKSFHYFSHFSRIFKEASKSEIVCVRLILKKWKLTDTPGYDGKLRSGKKIISAISFFVIFPTTRKFVIICAKITGLPVLPGRHRK